MVQRTKKILLVFILFFWYFWISNANISFTVSPIKYEIETSTWSTIARKALLFNRTDQTITIYTWVSDFEAKDDKWTPRFIKKSNDDLTGQELSNWINIEQESFEIWPKEKKEITFTISVPDNATPGWHYWAVFFKNYNAGNGGGQIKINVDYWVILLVNVEWEIIKDWELDDTEIKINNTWWYSDIEKDVCKYWDFTASDHDWRCFNSWNEIIGLINYSSIKDNEEKPEDNNENEDDENNNDFSVNLDTSFTNKWNTHIKPEGKITLIDDEWNEIKWIWEKSILNEDWAIIGKEIVDFLPINDVWWNVLPSTNRIFENNWRGFPYKTYDDEWNIIIKYWTPEEYYTRKNLEDNLILMPWETIKERICTKNIKAITELSYLDEEWEEVNFNSAKDFVVHYKEQYVWVNPYILALMWIILFFIFFLFIIFKKKKKVCKKCNKKIDKDMKICPYCWKKQKK